MSYSLLNLSEFMVGFTPSIWNMAHTGWHIFDGPA